MTDLTQVAESNFITIDTVCGADVFDPAGHKIGTIEDVKIDHEHGGRLYAMLSVGGTLRHHALPWSTMDYDANQHGYVVHLENAPPKDAITIDDKLKWDGGYGATLESCFEVTQPLSS